MTEPQFQRLMDDAFARGGRFKDLSGQRFGRLVVVRHTRTPTTGGRKGAFWECLCDCGQAKEIYGAFLRSGHTKSCGCLRRETISTIGRVKNATHGFTRLGQHRSEHRIWSGMLQRCENPKSKDFPRYGGRGITVHASWHSFETFIADVGMRPSIDHSIDRINNDGNYEPGNCRWATRSQQQNNKRNSRANKGISQ